MVVIFGRTDQQEAQQEAVLSFQGSSRLQAMHHDGRTIFSASRPTIDNAPRSLLCTPAILRSVTLNNQNSSRIVPAMKRTSLFAALLLCALPLFGQSNEFGFVVGGSRMFVDAADREDGVEFSDATFSLSNNSFDLFWATQMDPSTWLRFKVGRIEGPVPIPYIGPDSPDDEDTEPNLYRRDEEGEVQHAEMNVEYRFSEPYGSTGLFAGVGVYRQGAEGFDSSTNFGFNAGVNADFPITRRYGVVLEAAYHWNRTEFQPRYLTFGGGLRVSF
ncbi:MAG: hypothetical protein QOJ98_1701 [Acidobacteriota bacterium]|nr:hypothetical protein [Acidobacteriota bacterium]